MFVFNNVFIALGRDRICGSMGTSAYTTGMWTHWTLFLWVTWAHIILEYEHSFQQSLMHLHFLKLKKNLKDVLSFSAPSIKLLLKKGKNQSVFYSNRQLLCSRDWNGENTQKFRKINEKINLLLEMWRLEQLSDH